MTDIPLRPGSRRCQCGACKRYFSSYFSFDKHRTGEWDARTCLTPDAMRAKGMVLVEPGVWVSCLSKRKTTHAVEAT